MSYSKSIAIVLTTFVCATAVAVDAGAQTRGRGPAVGRGVTVGRAAPRVVGSSRVIVGAPLRSYYYPYYGFRPGLSIGIGLGFGYPYYYGAYGYPYYGYYGYPYAAYGYSYGYYPPAYVAPGYAVRPGGYSAYGGVRVQGAPRNAEVYVDGNYAGLVDDYDGVFQRLDLQPGSHEIEIRAAGRPLFYDVNITPGQTVTIHANAR